MDMLKLANKFEVKYAEDHFGTNEKGEPLPPPTSLKPGDLVFYHNGYGATLAVFIGMSPYSNANCYIHFMKNENDYEKLLDKEGDLDVKSVAIKDLIPYKKKNERKFK